MAKQKNQLAVFDVDDTLVNSGRKLKCDLVNALAGLGRQITPEQVIGDWYKLAESLGVSREDFDREFDKRKSWQESLEAGECPLFPDTLPCLDTLIGRGITLAALSKSIPEYTEVKLKHHGLQGYFTAVETVHPKEPNKIQGALNLVARLEPGRFGRAWFVGDKPEDITVAKDVQDRYTLTSGGIYLDRKQKPTPQEVAGYLKIRSLEEIPGIIGG